MTRTRDEGRVAEAARLYLSGLTRDQVAARLGVRGRTITRYLDAAGVTRPRGARKRPDVADEDVVALRDQSQLTWDQVAAETGMSRTGARMRYLAATGQPRPGRASSARPATR